MDSGTLLLSFLAVYSPALLHAAVVGQQSGPSSHLQETGARQGGTVPGKLLYPADQARS